MADPSIHAAKVSDELDRLNDALAENGAPEAIRTDIERMREELEFVVDGYTELGEGSHVEVATE